MYGDKKKGKRGKMGVGLKKNVDSYGRIGSGYLRSTIMGVEGCKSARS
jgi:hypothetical protein